MIKKTTIMLLTLLSLLISSNGFAGNLDQCKVLRAGTAPAFENTTLSRTGHVVWIQHSSWTGNRVYFISTDIGDAGLATLLAAIASSKTVYLEIGGSATAPNTSGSIITRVYLNSY